VIAMASYFLAFGWGILILWSLTGWGSVLNSLLFRNEQIDWGQRASWGMAFSVIVGGALNLFSYISRTTILLYLGLGIVGWIIGLFILQPPREESRPTRMPDAPRPRKLVIFAMLVFASLISVRFAASVSIARTDDPTGPAGLNRFYPVDDFQAYLVFPKKMMQTGSLGRDPFSDRRLETSLGGQYFLDTFVLSLLPLQHLHMLDSGVGLLLVAALLWGFFKERHISLGWSFFLLLLLVLMGPVERPQGGLANITSLYTGVSLFLSLCGTLVWRPFSGGHFLSRAFIIALQASAICALKSSFIPVCGVFLACSYFCYLKGENFKGRALLEFFSTGVLVAVLSLPWMISLYHSSGTLLYPLLGRGYHQSVYGNSLSPYSHLDIYKGIELLLYFTMYATFMALASLAIFYLASRQRTINGREAVVSLLIGAACGHMVMTLATSGASSARYSYPFVLATILALMVEILPGRGEVPWPKLEASRPVVVGAVAIFLIGWSLDADRIYYSDSVHTIKEGLAHASLVSNQEVARYERLQQSLPPREVILAKLEEPFLLDFKRNPVYLVDWVEVSPPPGIPLYKGSEPLARYLNAQSIRYVAYSYGQEFGKSASGSRYPESVIRVAPPWWGTILRQTYDFEDNLAELGRTRKRIYDDGRNFVLDLSQPSTGGPSQDATRDGEGKPGL
jgi:hypothetical protein